MQLSWKQKNLSQFISPFLKSSSDVEHFEKKKANIDFVFLKLQSLKTWLDKCLKRNV